MGLTGIAVIDVVETILTLALASKKMISALSIFYFGSIGFASF